ncbi:MAG: MlaD family protein [Solirubrobacteraceae bacterium]|nr:MAG: hypothetical protein DLM63_11325 [Solirubrobacterales bacterium]
MQKQAPNLPRIATMVIFALSCFGLLLFLWLSFGGAVPLKPHGYRLQVSIPASTLLADEADVRVAGVSVGKVVSKALDPAGNRTIATIELSPKFAPLRSDARAILRQKTLLGETYVELTPGTAAAKWLPENGRLANAQVQPAVTLDDIFQALDPTTRAAFRTWQQDLAKGDLNRGQNFSDFLGNLPTFAAQASDVLNTLDTQSRAVQQLVRNTGTVFAALTQNEGQLRSLITSSEQAFNATASQNTALSQSFQIFPTFLNESKATLARLQTFAFNTKPLIDELRPPLRDLGPTFVDTRRLAPYLRSFLLNLDQLTTASKTGLPALQQILDGARPLLGALGPFTEQFNPILQFLQLYQKEVIQFLNGSSGVKATTLSTGTIGQPTTPGPAHYLRQFGPLGIEALGIWPVRPPGNRGNAYFPPNSLSQGATAIANLMEPSFDCKNTPTGGPVPTNTSPLGGAPACFTDPPYLFQGKLAKVPQLVPNNYSKP